MFETRHRPRSKTIPPGFRNLQRLVTLVARPLASELLPFFTSEQAFSAGLIIALFTNVLYSSREVEILPKRGVLQSIGRGMGHGTRRLLSLPLS